MVEGVSDIDETNLEEEICRKDLIDAKNDDFLNTSFFDKYKEKQNANNKFNSIKTNKLSVINNFRIDEYKVRELTEYHRNFIAKKLNVNLTKCITLESKCMYNTMDLADLSKIDIFSIPNTVGQKKKKFYETHVLQRYIGERKFKIKHPKKFNFVKYQDAVVNSRNILRQHDIKYWTSRKMQKIYKYKEKNGILIEVI